MSQPEGKDGKKAQPPAIEQYDFTEYLERKKELEPSPPQPEEEIVGLDPIGDSEEEEILFGDPEPTEIDAPPKPAARKERDSLLSKLSWADILAPATDFALPTLFPFLMTLTGIARLDPSLSGWSDSFSRPATMAGIWCLLVICNYGYFTFSLGWIGESFGRLAFDPPQVLLPRPDWPWILKRMMPNVVLSLLLVGGLALLAG